MYTGRIGLWAANGRDSARSYCCSFAIAGERDATNESLGIPLRPRPVRLGSTERRDPPQSPTTGHRRLTDLPLMTNTHFEATWVTHTVSEPVDWYDPCVIPFASSSRRV